jgi:hypothetical protein
MHPDETTTTIDQTHELTIESDPGWLDYADLGLKALLVIAAFLIAVRL